MNKNHHLGFVVQARRGSSRLPDKVLKPFYEGKSILEIIVNRLKKEFPEYKVIVATTNLVKDTSICKMVEKIDAYCFRGSEENVLSRYLKTCTTYNLDYAFRVCSDNPFLDANSFYDLIKVLDRRDQDKIDYASQKVGDMPAIKTHYGFWGELVSKQALYKIQSCTNKKVYQEHVTNYIYEHPLLFNIKWLKVADLVSNNKNLRLTLDTPDDFKILKNLYKELIDKHIGFNSEEISSFLEKNKVYKEQMEKQIIENKK